MSYRLDLPNHISLVAISSTLELFLFNNLAAAAQIVPDNTLGAESS